MSDNLLKRLEALGFPMFEPLEDVDSNATLAVILARVSEENMFDYKAIEGLLKTAAQKDRLFALVAVSLALYKILGLKFAWAGRLHKSFSVSKKAAYEKIAYELSKSDSVKIGDSSLSYDRLKSIFSVYFTKARGNIDNLVAARGEMSLEYALAQIFSPKQKELFLKRFKGEKFTKTEQEYYSRAVKKKVVALANTELHRMSHELLR
jgi:hypothetical protein